MEKILKKYQDRLNDISRRNKSIRLSRIIKKKTFDVSELSKIDKALPGKVIDAIVSRSTSINLLKKNASSKEEESLVNALNYLRRDVELINKEKGYYECYLGYPFIQGNFFEGSFFRCPLFLYPVVIESDRQTQRVILKPLKEEPALINKTF